MGRPNHHALQSKILFSRLLTRAGDQAWDFAIPITLIAIFPTQLSLIASLYFLSKLGSVIFQPILSDVIDRWRRLNTALLGIGLQLLSVALVSFCIFQLSSKTLPDASSWSQPYLWPLLLGVSAGTIISNLGSGLMDIAVGNDWIPAVIPSDRLAGVNSRLQRLDLLTEVLSPVAAGALLAFAGSNGALTGFAIIAVWNAISFIPEALLLRNVFMSSSLLQTTPVAVRQEGRTDLLSVARTGWSEFKNQNNSLAMIAFSFLWLSALSPHGVLLTSFLKSGWKISETELGVFRGLGAVFGILATFAFPRVRKHLGLIPSTRLFIVFQALILLLSLPFFYFETAGGWVFLCFILLSRIGLYGFSLGETEIRQRVIPEGLRGKVNGVASALTSFATLLLFGLASIFADTKHFALMVVISVCAVSAGALTFIRWTMRRTDD